MSTHYRGTPQETQALDTFIKFTRATSAVEARLFQAETIEGLTQSQFGVLEALYHLGPLCQGELSSKLLKSTGNMTLVLDNLEKHGWVQRVRDTQDRRMVTVHLTPEGQVLIERVFPQVLAEIQNIFGILTLEEQQMLAALCRMLGKQTRE